MATTKKRTGPSTKSGKGPSLKVVGLVNTKKKKRGEPEYSKSDYDYFRELHQIVDKIFVASNEYGWTWADLAGEAGLSSATVDKLGDRITKWPRFSTVWKLAKAVGWELIAKEAPKRKSAPSLRIKQAS